MWPNWIQVYFYSWSARMVLVFESLLTLPYHHVDVDDDLGDIDDDSDHADGVSYEVLASLSYRACL